MLLSLLAGLLYVLGFVPYIAAILRGETRPSKATWLIWVVLDSVTASGMYAAGTLNGLMVGALIGAAVVAGLAFRYGTSGWTKLDLVVMVGGALGLVLWLMSHNAVYAIVINLVTMMIAAVPTVVSAWQNPRNEDRTAWTIYGLSCVLGLAAVTEWSVTGAMQSVVFLMIDGTVAAIVWLKR